MKKIMIALLSAATLLPAALPAKTVTVSTPIVSVEYDDGFTDTYGWFHPYGHYCEHCHRQHVKQVKKAQKARKKAMKKYHKQLKKQHKERAKAYKKAHRHHH